MARKSVDIVVTEALKKRESFSNRDIASATGLSRQAVQKRLAALVEEGSLGTIGRGRAVRYQGAGRDPATFRFPIAGLEEDRAWEEVIARLAWVRHMPDATRGVLQYAFTEMVNNARDHSQGTTVGILFKRLAGDRVQFQVNDDGAGIFARLRAVLGLEDELAAIQALTKGKVTTDPAHHTGEGIFFVSRVASGFSIESGGIRWFVDNVVGDTGINRSDRNKGTRVVFETTNPPRRPLRAVFDEYAPEHEFDRTSTWVKLFALGPAFISRLEGKRLMQGLERFREVRLDFAGVSAVGQGFVDEVFRVWGAAHPEVRLVPFNMDAAVEFMVKRGLPDRA